tara:strand:+ start:89 stop:541 length:453 start_codon:yes stop_codon:yes gene_type:complete
LNNVNNIYGEKYDFENPLNIGDLNNKLFCTFTTLEGIDGLIKELTSRYSIMYNKMFVLYIKSNDEYVVTYNVDQGNVQDIPENTILVHRKKETNTLYTINALNELIKSLNGGVVDTKFPIDWQHYKNCVLLTQHNELKQLNTKIHKIIEL